MREVVQLNYGWEYVDSFTSAFASGGGENITSVNLPHSCAQTPFDYFDEGLYQKVCGYRKSIDIPPSAEGKRIILIIGAAGHSAQVYVNGKPCGERHNCGYTQFEVELTDAVSPGENALVSIEVDSRETQNIPPFGHVIDYMTYGGLYREVRLEIRDACHIADIFAMPEKSGKLTVQCQAEGNPDSVRHTLFLDGKEVCGTSSDSVETNTLNVPDVKVWDIDSPVLYTLVSETVKNGEITDRVETRIGFREAVFKKDGFYLNGRKLKLVGLNRHQSYPYVGYAMPASMQRYDADILKNELGLNAVRTSHYPQSQHFIDRCDELGLLVFTEIPGWQHIGDEAWKKQAVTNTAEMVRQYRNHPSIILWGVRINESADDDEFYRRTNETAHTLDPTRPTGGVRCHKKSSLLEDVYTYNDFVHDGTNDGCEPKKAVTSRMKNAYLISEYNGHMYPTKTFDDEEHRLEHALRHVRVLDSVWSHKDIAGSFGWCFFDYNTHKDFGSGDRICYHGVCDMFRNPKLAASVYSVMQDETPVLEVSSSMDIGEHPASNRGRVYIITNADSVKFYINDVFIKEYSHKDSEFKNIPRPPIEITDYIGDRIEKGEKFSKKQAACTKDILNESTRLGMNSLSAKAKAKAAWLMLRYGMSFDDAYALYGKYIGNWGDKAVVYRFDAIKDGQVVKSVSKTPFTSLSLKAIPSTTELCEGETYDVAAIRMEMTDQNGNRLPFLNEAVEITLEGAAEIIGPKTAMLRGGCGGTYIKTIGKSGKAILKLTCCCCEATIVFNVISRKEELFNHD